MKLKNIKVGDYIEAKKDTFDGMTKKGQLYKVVVIDTDDTVAVDITNSGDIWWIDPADFRKPRTKIKKLDQSVFDGLGEKWRFAAVDLDGESWVYREQPKIDKGDDRWSASNTPPNSIGTGYDASNWQNSLIERDTAKEPLEVDLSGELTGSELCKAMLARGDKYVMCMVANNEANMFLATRPVVVHGCTDSGFISVSGCYSFAVAVNNQGEPLTASEAGL